MPSDSRVLKMLRDAGASGVTTGQFLRAYVGRHGSAVSSLRQRGFQIDTIPLDPKRPRGPARYVYVPFQGAAGRGVGVEGSPASSRSPDVAPSGLFDADESKAAPRGFADSEAA